MKHLFAGAVALSLLFAGAASAQNDQPRQDQPGGYHQDQRSGYDNRGQQNQDNRGRQGGDQQGYRGDRGGDHHDGGRRSCSWRHHHRICRWYH